MMPNLADRPREVCRWSNPDGSGYIYYANGRLFRRHRRGRPAFLLGGLSFEQARAHVEAQGDGSRQCGGPLEHSRRRIRCPAGRVAVPAPPPSEDRHSPSLAAFTPDQLRDRGKRVLAHRERVRADMERLGILPRGWDERPDPCPHLHDPEYQAARQWRWREHEADQAIVLAACEEDE